MKTEEQITKRYQRVVKECSKEYDKHKDTDKVKHIAHIQREILSWVLGKD
jgi:hypothetical protein